MKGVWIIKSILLKKGCNENEGIKYKSPSV